MNGDKAFDDFLSIDTMECIGAERPTEDNNIYQATYYRDIVKTTMDELRAPADALEMIVDKDFWPFPSYGDLLFEV